MASDTQPSTPAARSILLGIVTTIALAVFDERVPDHGLTLLAAVAALALLRIWEGRLRLALVVCVLPVSLAAASIVAAYEENQFVQKHGQGIGMTPRWTVSHHWLAYDAQTRTLYGSD